LKSSKTEEQERHEPSLLNNVFHTAKNSATSAIGSVLRVTFIFVTIHAVFWGIENLHFRYCASDFWFSLLSSHSLPCKLLRDASTLARNANANLLALGIGVMGNALHRVAPIPEQPTTK
jgi:hypothetical protein